MSVRLTAIAGFLVVLALFGTACGGGDSNDALSLDAYLSEMERLDNEAEAQQQSLQQEFEAAAGGDIGTGSLTDQFKDALEVYYVGLVDAGKEFIDQVDELEPPSEAEEEHDEYVAAYDDVLVELNAVIDEIPGLTTAGDADALLSNEELSAAFERGNAACRGLQQLADDNSVDVDFGCAPA